MRFLGLTLVLLLSVVSAAPWPVRAAISAPYSSLGSHPVAPGVSRDWGTVTAGSGRQSVNVVEVDPRQPGIGLRTSLARGRVTGRQRTTAQAFNYSTEGRRVVTAINGATFGSWPMGHVAARGLNVQDRELLTAGRVFAGNGPILGFGIDSQGRAMIGTPSLDIEVTLPDGSIGRLHRVNQGRLVDEGVLFTPRFDTHTWTDNVGDEYVIDGVQLPIGVSGTYDGTVSEVRRGLGDAPLGAGQVVFSVTGAAAAPFTSLAVGDRVTFKIEIEHGWQDIVHAVGGRELLVRDGVTDITPLRPTTATATHPRSAVGITRDGRVLLVTVDGRSDTSGGLTLEELAELMIERGAVSALNLDGGGSTTLAVRRPGDVEVGIVNAPSDGSERTVATTLQVISSWPTASLDALVVSPRQAELYEGQRLQYTVKGHDARYNGIVIDPATLRWTVSNDGASVNSSALLTALESGEHSVTARTQGVQDTVSIVVRPDGGPPAVSPPIVSLRGGVALSTTKAKLVVRWTASDEHSGIARVELQRRVAGGSWSSVSLSSSTATSAFGGLAFGRTVQYRVRATDRAGNTSGWVLGRTVQVSLYDDTNPALLGNGEWLAKSSTSAIGSTYARSRTVGASVSLTFSGSQVAWVGLRGPKHGPAEVYLDGGLVARVALTSSSTLYRRVLYVSPLREASAGPGTSTLMVRNAGTATRPRADVDALVVLVPVD